ncbi:DUF2797 domain-containing protein [Halomonas sp. ATBC28]|uniref:DUF2797 domain-containing protein n=1 Tax=Vreelandella titanicae TaxID=664683 RepID=A0AAP9NLZ4_9GAMM|nr:MULTISPECIES: DUF2797 domain-containing protein [Halomonas]NAO97880.1 DUF2797 domain-containing protein [Halomonas sp. MG34]PKH62419.1 DUF2797 domain-containing protein [Halomonas sp. Choline-3u-9]QKS24025.1 hypothetical protein FX987_01792 [Halomonas titanicae]TMU22947.1 DUF2797 domain-containing protein [Halomonas sp. ATBC28]|tara:strand:- start:2425 stop:3285 length:861 start_codon:yes stop_codon:yes gene_type:complete
MPRVIEAAVPGFSVQGCLSKMAAALPGRQDQPVVYHLRAGEHRVALNERIGEPLSLRWTGAIACTHCGRATKKSFAQGHCYPCFKRLAQCDTCIMKPETCHFFQGTCREPEWGERHCFQPHIVYLANSSGLKVGITRKTQMPTRWLDQGAIQALPILEVDTRQQSGFVEMLFKEQVADRTNWRAMLKGDVETMDLSAERDRLLTLLADGLHQLRETHGADAIRLLEQPAQHFHYPVSVFPKKVVSHNFDKQPLVEGVLQGVKGQYLILDSGVINLRKFTGYEIQVS